MKNLFFFRENSDFPWFNTFSQWKNPLSILFLAVNFLCVNQFSKCLGHFLGLLGCKMMTISYFGAGVSEQAQFPKDGVRRVAHETDNVRFGSHNGSLTPFKHHHRNIKINIKTMMKQ